MFEKSFSFKGRIRRSEYGISFIIYFVLNLIISAFTEAGGEEAIIFSLLFTIPNLWFFWAQGAKRCHDLGKSGWFQIIPFYVLWMIFQEGEVGVNKYGDNPKGNTVQGYSQTMPGGNAAPVPPPVPNKDGSYSGGYDGGHNNHGAPQPQRNYQNAPNNTPTSGGYKSGDLYN